MSMTNKGILQNRFQKSKHCDLCCATQR